MAEMIMLIMVILIITGALISVFIYGVFNNDKTAVACGGLLSIISLIIGVLITVCTYEDAIQIYGTNNNKMLHSFEDYMKEVKEIRIDNKIVEYEITLEDGKKVISPVKEESND